MFQIIALGFALYHVVVQLPSGVQLFVTPWTVAFQAPLSMGFPRQEYWKVKVKLLSHVQLFVTPWTVAYQVPLSMGFFQARVLEWVCHFLLQEIFPNQVLNLCLLLVRWIHYPRTTREAHSLLQYWLNSEALWGRSDCQQHHSLCSSSKGKYVSPVAPTLGCLSIALIYVDPWRSHTAKGTLVLPDQFWVIRYTLEAGSRISPTSSMSSDNRKKRVL